MNLMIEKWLDYFDEKVRALYDEYREHQTRAFWMEFGLLYGNEIIRESFALLNSFHRNELENAKAIMGMSEKLLEVQRLEESHQDPLELAAKKFEQSLALAKRVAQARKEIREAALADGLNESEAAEVVESMSDYLEVLLGKGGSR